MRPVIDTSLVFAVQAGKVAAYVLDYKERQGVDSIESPIDVSKVTSIIGEYCADQSDVAIAALLFAHFGGNLEPDHDDIAEHLGVEVARIVSAIPNMNLQEYDSYLQHLRDGDDQVLLATACEDLWSLGRMLHAIAQQGARFFERTEITPAQLRALLYDYTELVNRLDNPIGASFMMTQQDILRLVTDMIVRGMPEN